MANGFTTALRLATRPGPLALPIPRSLDPSAARAAVRWITPIGVGIGFAWMGLFRATGLIFRDPEFTQVRAVHALAVVALECLLTGTGLLYGMARAVGTGIREHEVSAGAPSVPASLSPSVPSYSMLVLILTILTYWVFIDSLPSHLGWYPPRDDPRHLLNALYPLGTVRPLFLAPIWGRWAFLLAAGVGRAAPHADPATRSLCAAVRPAKVLRWLLVPLIPTIAYTLRQQRLFGGFIVVLLVLLITYLAALLFARRHAGQTHETLAGSGTVAQIVFLAAYRALCV